MLWGIVLIMVGVVFAANAVNTLSGRYGPVRVMPLMLASTVALASFVSGVALIF